MNTKLVEELLFYVDQHIYEKISLADLANIAGYSPFYFSTLFTETMGISVTSYIRTRKLQHAALDLLSCKKITEVAFRYSFESHEGFTRSFTKFFGASPTIFRKNVTSYTIPNYVVPNIITRKEPSAMKDSKSLYEDMLKIPFAFWKESLKEWEEGHCTKISMKLLPNNTVLIEDNGRGIPLGDFPTVDLQTANSLCERLQLTIYRGGYVYHQDYVRGIPQHNINRKKSEHSSGMEVLLKPDSEIFGVLTFESVDVTISTN